MSSDVVTLEVSDYVAVATLNRPPVNAINAEMRNRIIEIFDQATDRPDIRVVVLTAQGKIFSAGADLNPFLTRKLQYYAMNNDNILIYRIIICGSNCSAIIT